MMASTLRGKWGEKHEESSHVRGLARVHWAEKHDALKRGATQWSLNSGTPLCRRQEFRWSDQVWNRAGAQGSWRCLIKETVVDGRAMHFSIDINRISVTAMTTPLRDRKCSYVSRAGFRSRPFVFYVYMRWPRNPIESVALHLYGL